MKNILSVPGIVPSLRPCLIILFCLLLIPEVAGAQTPPPSRIRGRVTNADGGEPLRRAYVSVVPATGGTPLITMTTNEQGFYAGTVAPGRYDLVITYLLFPEKTIADVAIEPGQETIVDAALNSRPEAVVTGFVHEPQASGPETPLSGVTVSFKPAAGNSDKVYGAVTGSDGTFSLSLPTGTYEVTVLAVFYAKKVIPRFLVSRTRPATMRVALSPEAVQMKEVVVEGNVIRNTKVAELSIRRNEAVVTDAVSRDAMNRSTDSDAGQVLNRVTGLSIKDGKYLVVRGLSERYASTQLNGVRIGSPEPNRKIVPLDIFPAGLLDDITVQKAYSPDQPGEFGGGTVKINTRDIPDEPVWAQSFSLGVSPGTTGSTGLGYEGGGLDFLAIDDGLRGLPELIRNMAGNQLIVQKSPLRPNEGGFTKDELTAFSRSFQGGWAPRNTTPGANSGFSQTFGRRTVLLGKPLGVMGSLSWSQGAETTEGALNFYEDDSLKIKAQYDELKTTQSVLWGGTGTLTWRLGKGTTVKGGLFYSRSSDDEARRYEGYNKDFDTLYRSERILYVQRYITAGTFGAEHTLPFLGSKFEWKLNRSQAGREEPDRRENGYEQISQQTGAGTDTLVWRFSRTGASRMFSGLEDHEKGYELHLTFPFHGWAPGDARFKVGTSRQKKSRTSWARRFTFAVDQGLQTVPIDQLLSDENLGTIVRFREQTRGTDFYWAEQEVDASYVMVDLPLLKRLRGLFGARFEQATQTITDYSGSAFSSPKKSYGNDKDDVMPALNLTYALGGRTNLRFAASQTVVRPDLRELTDFDLTNYVSGGPETGNPNLKRGLIQSCDLRWETFPNPGSLVAVSLFYKNLKDPIEKTLQGGEAPRVFPNNGLDGKNRGVELEFRGGLGGAWKRLERFGLTTNLTLLSTEVNLPKSGVQTASTRPLEGQSKYVTNIGLFYTSPQGGMELSLFANSYGRRLTGVGVQGQPDVFERSRTTMDATAGWRISRTFKLKWSGKNLTDAPVVVEQGHSIREKRNPGASYSLGLTVGS